MGVREVIQADLFTWFLAFVAYCSLITLMLGVIYLAGEAGKSTTNVAELKAQAMEHWRSTGMQFVDIQYSHASASHNGGKACYRIDHPLEDHSNIGCLEKRGDEIVDTVRMVQ